MDLQEALANRNVMTTPIFLLFLDKYGGEILGNPAENEGPWDADTINMELQEDFPGVKIDEEVVQRIYAGIVMTASNSFFIEPSTFNYIAQIVGDDETPFDPQVASLPEPEECAWAVVEYTLLQGDDIGTMSDDVKEFISQICKNAGFAKAPGVLAKATLPWKSHDENLADESASQAQATLHIKVSAFVKMKMNTLIDQLNAIEVHEGRAKDSADDIKRTLERQ